MIRTLDLRGKKPSESEVASLLPRAKVDIEAALELVMPIIERVKNEAERAVSELALEFDGFSSDPIPVSKKEIDAAFDSIDRDVLSSIEIAIDRVRRVSSAAVPAPIRVEVAPGSWVSTRYQAMDSVGVYAPGGKAVYPSSVIMSVVPAQVAGVARIALASPGQKDFAGRPHPTVLATAKILGIEEVYCMGGAAAMAAYAHGLEEIGLSPVRLITGPGNIYVAAAKRLLRGKVAIDSEAGTTEIMTIADESADASLVAADLISQAEHDESAAAILLTDSESLIERVKEELRHQIPLNKHTARIMVALNGQQSALVLCDSMEQASTIANHYATEHLEIQCSDPAGVLAGIANVGAVFIGAYSPVSLGDYLAGSNHVLPTGGSARSSSGLGVHTFLRPQQVIEYSKKGLQELDTALNSFAEAEDLPAHGRAVSERFRTK